MSHEGAELGLAQTLFVISSSNVSLYKRQQTNHPHHLPLPKFLLLKPSYKGTLIKALQLKYTGFSYLDTSTLICIVPFSKRKKSERLRGGGEWCGQPEPFSTRSKIELTMPLNVSAWC